MERELGGGGEDVKNLQIQYTTDTGPLETRSWQNVYGLKNGFKGTEFLHVTTKVNPNGNVIGDVHNSNDYQAMNPTLVSGPPHLALIPGAGWASLTFRTVNATGLRISFRSYKKNPYSPSLYCKSTDFCWQHYRVGEFGAHFEEMLP